MMGSGGRDGEGEGVGAPLRPTELFSVFVLFWSFCF